MTRQVRIENMGYIVHNNIVSESSRDELSITDEVKTFKPNDRVLTITIAKSYLYHVDPNWCAQTCGVNLHSLIKQDWQINLS